MRASLTKKILVVDDEDDLRATVAEYFRLLGHVVRVARDGPEALRLMASEPIDLVLLDWQLPGELAGAPLLASIRRASPAKIAVLSADPLAVIEAQSLRADASLAKPFSLPQLRELLDVLTRD